ncbi:MAG: 5-(carboxyamino)imidazole ribonucleotide synthase [Bdellovibrionales bacterium]
MLGIIGGGQLARMLALTAHTKGWPITVLTEKANDPAAQVVGQAHVGPLEHDRIRQFLADIDILTFESEFTDIDLIKELKPKTLKVFPALNVIKTIQDRLTQKLLLERFRIPTAEWCSILRPTEISEAQEKFSGEFVLKARRFGYDGYGTFVYSKGKCAKEPVDRMGTGFIAERKIKFKRELAFSVARSTSGQTRLLPLVHSIQKDSRCYSVSGPIRHRGFNKLSAAILNMMKSIDYVGILAIELFETKSGLLVNELAPRVHNSAHYSMDALQCSQFEYHLRAGLGLDLPAVSLRSPGFAMINLLGGGKTVRFSEKSSGYYHWYGKDQNKPGRKMGHINTLGPSGKVALKRAEDWRKDFQL